MDPRVRRLYVVCVGTSIALVLVGWLVSIRSAISGDLIEIKENATATFEKVGEGLNQIGGGARDYKQDFSQSLEAAKASYEENKAQQ